jgi:TolB-like protein
MLRDNRMTLALLLLLTLTPCGLAQDDGEENGEQETTEQQEFVDYPLAILPFRERGDEVKGMGGQASDLLFAGLVDDPALWLVDREDLEKTLAEQELNLSGVVKPNEAAQIGQVTGAKILVTGSVFQVGKSLYVVAKVIGTETTRVLGASAKGSIGDGVDALMPQLAESVAKMVKDSSTKLVAAPIDKKDRAKAIDEKLGDAKRPAVFVSVTEQHVNGVQIDPAAETELILYLKDTGFNVIDNDQGSRKQAKILIEGEGMSEFASRRGNLVSVKARLEVKAIDRASGEVIVMERQTRVAVDLSEQIAAKTALQEAAADIAERLLPKLVNVRDAEK